MVVNLLKHFLSLKYHQQHKYDKHKIALLRSILQTLKLFTSIPENIKSFLNGNMLTDLCRLVAEANGDIENNHNIFELVLEIFSNTMINLQDFITTDIQESLIIAIINAGEKDKNCESLQQSMLNVLSAIITKENVAFLVAHEGLIHIFETMKTLQFSSVFVNQSLNFINSTCQKMNTSEISWLVRKTDVLKELARFLQNWDPTKYDSYVSVKCCCEIIRSIQSGKRFSNRIKKCNMVSCLVNVLSLNWSNNNQKQSMIVLIQVLKTFSCLCQNEETCVEIAKNAVQFVSFCFDRNGTINDTMVKEIRTLLEFLLKYKSACIYLNNYQLMKKLYDAIQSVQHDKACCVQFALLFKHTLSVADGFYGILEEQLCVSKLLESIKQLHQEHKGLMKIINQYCQIANEKKPNIKSRDDYKQVFGDEPDEKTSSNAAHINKNVNQILITHKNEIMQLKSLNDNLKKLYLPLHKLSAQDLCNTIKYIVYQDASFEKNLITTIETFIKMQLSGSFLYGFSSTTAQLLVENDLLSFMSKSTLDKMFIYLYKMIKDLKDKSAIDIAYILYKYPLTCLVNKIMGDVIDGQQFILYHKSMDESKTHFVAEVTGWKPEIVEKIYSQLMQHDDAMETIINQNIYLPLHKFTAQNVANTIKWWIYNDIRYKENLQKMKSAFVERGKTIINLRTKDVKILVQKEMCRFMTNETFNIMFNGFSNIDGLKSKTASDIAVALYDYPLDRLLSEILKKNIDGVKIINFLEQHACDLTGWNQKKEIYQLQSILSRHSVLPKQLFVSNMSTVLETTSFSDAVKTQITDTILRFNIETLQLQVNNGKRDEAFSESIINMVDSMDRKSNDTEEDFVKNVYEVVAKCFMSRNNVISEAQSMKDAANSWICCNCSNHNFPKRIANRWNENTSICSLCGIKQIESVVLNIKGFDTFIMVNDDSEVEDKSDQKEDDIDKIIAKVLNTSKFNLACPNANSTMDCPSFKRLARNLIAYKRWISTIYQKTNNDNIARTIQVNIAKVIDDNTYKMIFVDSASNCRKISDQDIKELKQLFENNVDNIQHVQTFLDLKLRGFVEIIKTHTPIKPARVGFLYRSIMKTLKERARTIEFGAFLSEAAMADVETDYYHILKTHVNKAPDKNTIRHAFRFFKKVVHSEDTPEEIKQCRSCIRRAQRIRSNQAQSNAKSMVNTHSLSDDKNIWSLTQYYYQSQLDVIHSYLVHSNYKYFTQRFSDQQNNSQRPDEVESVSSDPKIIEDALQNNDKYVSYGFGVEHLYQHLDFVYDSIYDEMRDNKIFSISEEVYQVMLIKSIKTHKVALNAMMDNNKLICKYFDKDYNIIRNEPIAIRHIFALSMYTDMTNFCTKFRQTYRQMNKETTDKEVTKRHKQFYHYARALFEAIDMFGNPMPSSLKVFHGLDTRMCFKQFTAYFSQPISTTITLCRAQQFSQDTGIILKLKSATEYFNDPKKIPKYLSVSWLSDFPFENEKLFYGAFVVFKIHDIIEANTLKSHKYELEMLNKLQQTLTNQKIIWKDEKKQMVNGLIELIERQKIMNETENNEQKDEKKEDKQESKYKTKYGSDLFNYFCTNANTEKNQKIEITDFKSSLDKLYKPLFTNGNDFVLSFVPITQLFPHLKEIILNEISKDEMTTQTEYVNAVLDYINSAKKRKMFLETIKFQSKQQNDMKPSKTLRDLASDHENVNRFAKLGWSIKYDFESKTHVLTFKKQPQ